jgi:hypothetical protein
LSHSKQEQKYKLGLAGEFLVAGELLRRNVSAAITYGNAKKADVVAINGSSACSIEVKTTREPKWVVGGAVPEPNELPWVLVYLPNDNSRPAEFYVLTSRELHAILKPVEEAFRKKSQGPAVYSVRREQIVDHKDAWQKITSATR